LQKPLAQLTACCWL